MRLVHQRLCRVVVNRKNTLRTVRQRTADDPPMLGRIRQRQFQSGVSVKIQWRTVRQDTADSPRLDRMVGSARLDLYWMSLSLPSTKPHTTSKSLSLSLSSTWGRRQGQGFLAWLPDGPRTSPDSSQVCASCPPGILTNP